MLVADIVVIVFVSWIDFASVKLAGWDKFRTCAVICTLWETWEQYENYKLVSLCRRTVY